MKFFDYIRYAFKNLGRQKLRTFLTTIAVVIGAIAVTTLVSLGQNTNKSFAKMINDMGILSIVTVSPDPDSENGGMLGTNGGDTTGGKKIDDQTIKDVKKIAHVGEVTPITNLNFESMRLKDGGGKKVRADILALDPDAHALQANIKAGRMVKRDDAGKIVLGPGTLKSFGYADKPEAIVGKKVLLAARGWYTGWGVDVPKPPENAGDDWYKKQDDVIKEIEVEVVGVASASGEDGQSYTNMEWARATMMQREWRQDKEKWQDWQGRQQEAMKQNIRFNEQPPGLTLTLTDQLAQNGYNALIVRVDEPKNADAVVAGVKKLQYGATTAKEMIDQILKIIKLIGEILAAIGGLALVVAAIGIINTMAMAIFERTREIGVMRACGATRATVRRLFTFEASLIGFWGGAIGVVISYGLSQIGNYFAGNNSSIPISDFAYFPYWLIGGVIGFTTIIALFAGLYPALKAARLNPVEALRQNK